MLQGDGDGVEVVDDAEHGDNDNVNNDAGDNDDDELLAG